MSLPVSLLSCFMRERSISGYSHRYVYLESIELLPWIYPVCGALLHYDQRRPVSGQKAHMEPEKAVGEEHPSGSCGLRVLAVVLRSIPDNDNRERASGKRPFSEKAACLFQRRLFSFVVSAYADRSDDPDSADMGDCNSPGENSGKEYDPFVPGL